WQNLASSINNLKLHEIFIEHGTILSCKVAVSEAGDSKGYGFVQYAEEESAKNAIEKLNGITIEGKELYVAHLVRRNDRDTSFTNLYVKNLEDDISEEVLAEKFSEFGKITSLVITKDVNGVSRGFGFVNFEIAEDAMRAKECMHGKQIGSKVLYVARAQKKVERRQILRLQFKERSRKVITDEESVELYLPGDVVVVCKFERNLSCNVDANKGISRGFGFISFSNPEEAIIFKAINTLNGSIFHGKTSYVAKAQSKEERKTYLQQRNTHLAKLITNESRLSEDISSLLGAASPNKRKDILGERLLPLVKKIKDSSKIIGMLLEIDNFKLVVLLESLELLASKVEEAARVLEHNF
ncbi:polyadenylate-binding protein 7-like, partial [Pistacia vera]|uniref:polyadenylate-binding protein 7-like n=1 Tax=Pistacia vera TaxID=55513 RepID=UPI0012631811